MAMRIVVFLFLSFLSIATFAQDSVFHWSVTSKRLGNNQYEILFATNGNASWQLYAPNQLLSDVPTTELQFNDSAIQLSGPFKETGNVKNEQSNLFNTTV